MNVDLAGSTKVLILTAPAAQANNTGGGGLDLQAFDFVGELAVTVAIGKLTAGDTNSVLTVALATSDTNNISNAVAYTPTSGPTNVSTTNNAAVVGDISLDTRNSKRFLFTSPVITGGNSPSASIAVLVRGVLKGQPLSLQS